MNNIVIVGASGGIGNALLHWCSSRWGDATIWATGQTVTPPSEPDGMSWLPLDLTSDTSIASFAATLREATETIDLLLICSGWLHDDQHMPEKSMQQLSGTAFSRALRINAAGPLLLISQLESLLVRAPGSVAQRSRIICLSAKVGSISDNSLGGWHAYRMSKAALNMGVKNLGIEFARNKRKPLVAAVHPGTTHSNLSAPFAKRGLPVVAAKETAARLGGFLESMNEDQQGGFFHWDGTALPY